MADIVNYIGALSPEQQEFLTLQFNKITEVINPIIEKAATLIVTDVSQKELMQQARESRIILKNKRGEVEKLRKGLKERSLREGQAIDAVAKFLTGLIEPAEEHLEKQEKFKEIKEAERKEELRRVRTEELLKYTSDATLFNLAEMSDEQYQAVLSGQKAATEKREADEKKAEADRIAKEEEEAAERERMRIENDRLRAEAEAREKAIAEERRKAEVERKRLADIAAREAEAREKAEQVIRDEKAKKDAAEKARIAEEKKAAKAPDKMKLLAFSKLIYEIADPGVNSAEAKQIVKETRELLDKTSKFITDKANSL